MKSCPPPLGHGRHGPVFQKDFAALSKAVSSTNGELAEYMALFQDVPDEI